jgi:hypothetical protein
MAADASVASEVTAAGLEVQSFSGHLLQEPGDVKVGCDTCLSAFVYKLSALQPSS